MEFFKVVRVESYEYVFVLAANERDAVELSSQIEDGWTTVYPEGDDGAEAKACVVEEMDENEEFFMARGGTTGILHLEFHGESH